MCTAATHGSLYRIGNMTHYWKCEALPKIELQTVVKEKKMI